jgi:hypothetical protein
MGRFFRVDVKGTGILSKRLGKRTFNNQVLKPSYQDIGVRWHVDYRKKHFTHGATREYNYTPRKGEAGSGRRFKGSYTAKKLAAKGHTKPLVYTGESERLTRLRDVRATFKGARVVLKANKLNFRAKNSRINMRREMTTISNAEAEHLTRYLQDRVTMRMNSQFPPTTKQI